jgi:hypothetical protein
MPTAVLVRQVLAPSPSSRRPSLVAKLKAARDRKIAQGIKCGGRKTYSERSPELVAAAKALQAERPRLSLRKIAARLAEQGYTAPSGEPYAAMSVWGCYGARHSLEAPLHAGGAGRWKAAQPHTCHSASPPNAQQGRQELTISDILLD